LPRGVWAHGYVQWEGTKMSKTAGTAVTLDEAIERHGPDALRYFLLREVGFEADGNFTWDRFDERYTADLADGLGNLASRSLAMLQKYRSGVVPEPGQSTTLDVAGRQTAADYSRAMDGLDLRRGVEAVWGLVGSANLFVQQTAPWALAKAGKEAELDGVLSALASTLCRLALMASPFIPGKAQMLWENLGLDGQAALASWTEAENPRVSGRTSRKPEILFPKLASV
jgi:methionyl-tRNA synthetase